MRSSANERAAWCVVFALHAAAVQWLFPWTEAVRTDPMLDCDYPIHAQRVHLYRECLFQNGIPWGCDPTIMTGQILDPAQDTTKPQQVLGVFLWRLPAAQIVRLYLWLTAAAVPLGALALFRAFRLDGQQQLWSMVVLLSSVWLFHKLSIFFQWGMAAFLSASLFAPFVLALFLRFLERPRWLTYCWFVAASSLLFLLHVTGPFIIAAPLVMLTLSARPLVFKWRLALLATPAIVLALNSFWAVPCYWAMRAPRPDWAPVPAQLLHPYLKYSSLSRVGEILASPSGLLAIVASLVGVYGLVGLRRQAPSRHVLALGLAIATVGVMIVFGSFVPVFQWMQPARFAFPAAVLLSIPVGAAIAQVIRQILGREPSLKLFDVAHFAARSPIPPYKGGNEGGRTAPGADSPGSCAGLISWTATPCSPPSKGGRGNWPSKIATSVSALRAAKFASSASVILVALTIATVAVRWNLPRRLHCKSADPALATFIAERTNSSDRLLVQACIEKEPAVFPIVWHREVLGCAFPDLDDPLQFTRKTLLGRPFAEWTPIELTERLDQWGISWVLAGRPDAIELLARTFHCEGDLVGGFRAFRIPKPTNRVETGSARVTASLNRLDVDQITAPNGLLVLRYRFHPAWKATSGSPILRFSAPGDPCGFIAIAQPPKNLTLEFDPRASLKQPWPTEKFSGIPERNDADRRLK